MCTDGGVGDDPQSLRDMVEWTLKKLNIRASRPNVKKSLFIH